MSNIESTKGEIVMYQPDETIRLEVRVESETVWLTQQQISDLFLRDRTVINRHINNVFKEGECTKKAMCIFCTFQIQTSLLCIIAWMSSYQGDQGSVPLIMGRKGS